MKKSIIAAALLAVAMTVAAPANATIYTYRQANNNVLTINTATGAGTLVGTGINLSFTSTAFTSFAGGAAPTGTFNLQTITGTRTVSGRVQNVRDVNRETLTFGANGSTSLWFQTTDRFGRAVSNDVVSNTTVYTPPLTGSTGGTPHSAGCVTGKWISPRAKTRRARSWSRGETLPVR